MGPKKWTIVRTVKKAPVRWACKVGECSIEVFIDDVKFPDSYLTKHPFTGKTVATVARTASLQEAMSAALAFAHHQIAGALASLRL